uniref:Uncharacterized protein n=1 Tax=Siphoviridae sp. ctevH2 TaxID=2825593 RepID=A0A8S5UAX2_9CAUD|nr:MAG TPA: hypothetical protein [Siphoviridae sp. ctevH2]
MPVFGNIAQVFVDWVVVVGELSACCAGCGIWCGMASSGDDESPSPTCV